MHLFCLSLCSIDFYTNHFLLDDALWSSSETTAVCACCKDLPAQPHIATFQLLSLPRNCQYHGHTNFTSRRTALHLNQSITMGIFEKLQARTSAPWSVPAPLSREHPINQFAIQALNSTASSNATRAAKNAPHSLATHNMSTANTSTARHPARQSPARQEATGDSARCQPSESKS